MEVDDGLLSFSHIISFFVSKHQTQEFRVIKQEEVKE